MKVVALFLAVLSLVDALAPRSVTTSDVSNKQTSLSLLMKQCQKTGTGVFAAATIAASAAFFHAPPPAQATTFAPMTTMTTTSSSSSSMVLAEKIIREGVYGEYEMDAPVQVYDDARSTFKPASETKSKKGKYTALLAILIVGSFVIPMAQYFWYVRDDDSTEKFFGQQQQKEPEPPKKKGWF